MVYWPPIRRESFLLWAIYLFTCSLSRSANISSKQGLQLNLRIMLLLMPLFNRYHIREWLEISFRMLLISIISGILMIFSHYYIENVSRREVNLSFVLWMVCLNCIFIALEFFIQSIVHCLQHLGAFDSSDSCKSIIFTTIGHNGMLLFLLANLLTGFVNFTIDTLSAPNWIAFLVLVVYTSILSYASVFCYKHNIRLKFSIKQKSE